MDIEIINADFLDREDIPPVDLIVTSPPYNLGIEYGVHDDSKDYDEWLSFMEAWMKKALGHARDDGRMCLNIPLDNNRQQVPVYADVMAAARKAGWKYHATVVWDKGVNSRGTAWGSWMSASAPFIVCPVEMIVILYKERWKKDRKGETTIGREEFMWWTNSTWKFPGEQSANVGHPAPFPVELPARCIKLLSYVGDLVLDPFVGSGTTMVACRMLGRRGIGFDIDENYCRIARERVAATPRMGRFKW